jgi:hypothetical protein
MQFWCDILRDDNAIHTDPEAAARAGFGKRRVNPGPANLALLINARMADAPGQRIARIEASFLGNVFEGDALVVRHPTPETATLHRQIDPETPVLAAVFYARVEPE